MGLLGGVIGGEVGGLAGEALGGLIGGKRGAKMGANIGRVGGGLAGKAFPMFKKGGKVAKTGLAYVHKGEFVLPAGVKPTKEQKAKVARMKKN